LLIYPMTYDASEKLSDKLRNRITVLGKVRFFCVISKDAFCTGYD
jgi:hypothetical protein